MTGRLIDDLTAFAHPARHPDGDPYQGLSVKQTELLSRRYRIPGYQVEIAALEAGIVPERYCRNLKSFSLKDQRRLLESRVIVVGLGGLGGGVAETLARLGIGTLHLVDGDTFDDGNLNRQVLCNETNLGQNKADAAVEQIRRINSSIILSSYPTFLGERNGEAMLRHVEVAVDCLGELPQRFVLEDLAKRVGRPLISAAVAGLSGHLMTIFPEDSGLNLVYGDPDRLPAQGAEAELGCLPQITALMAALQCAEITKVLLGNGRPLRNRMLAVDLIDNTFEVVALG